MAGVVGVACAAPAGCADGNRALLGRRPPTSAFAVFGTAEPVFSFCRAEQAPIAVAAIRILAELARTIRRHRTGLQRQARCFAQQNAPSRSVPRGRTASDARCERDRAEIAADVRPLDFDDWRGVLCEVPGRSTAKQPSQYFDHDGEQSTFLPCSPGTVPQADSRRRQACVRLRWVPHSTPR